MLQVEKPTNLTPEGYTNREMFYHLGIIQLALGERDEAIKSLKKALSFLLNQMLNACALEKTLNRFLMRYNY